MKALSLHQPWATWIATGAKSIETRTRPVSYRGPLLICSTKRPPEATDPWLYAPRGIPAGRRRGGCRAGRRGAAPCAARRFGRLSHTTRTKPVLLRAGKHSRHPRAGLSVRGFPGLFEPPADVIAAVEAQDLARDRARRAGRLS